MSDSNIPNFEHLKGTVPPNVNQLSLAPKAVSKILLLLIFLLLVAHVGSLLLTYSFPDGNRVISLVDKYFNFNNEGNFPTFFSSVNLLIASGLLFIISKISVNEKSAQHKIYWKVLSLVFLFLCLDEAAQIHDELVLTVRNRLPELPGFFYYAWVIPYTFLVLGVGVYLFRFVLSLPHATRNLFFLSGFIYVFGAIGFELVEGYVEKYSGRVPVLYDLLITIEELLEMVGVVIFIYALLSYLNLYKTKLSVSFNSRN